MRNGLQHGVKNASTTGVNSSIGKVVTEQEKKLNKC